MPLCPLVTTGRGNLTLDGCGPGGWGRGFEISTIFCRRHQWMNPILIILNFNVSYTVEVWLTLYTIRAFKTIIPQVVSLDVSDLITFILL